MGSDRQKVRKGKSKARLEVKGGFVKKERIKWRKEGRRKKKGKARRKGVLLRGRQEE